MTWVAIFHTNPTDEGRLSEFLTPENDKIRTCLSGTIGVLFAAEGNWNW